MLFCYLSIIEGENDRSHFEKLYRKYEKDVSRRIRRLLRNHEDAEDAMQNTWLAITKNLSFFHTMDDVSIRAYILRIARNQAISIYRKRRHEEDMTCDIETADISDDGALIRICEENEIETIVRCIDALDEKYSEVLNLFYFHHHSAAEIASLFNLSEHTVRSRISRGKEKLIQLLTKEGLV